MNHPHSLEAEREVLGQVLVTPHVIEHLCHGAELGASDFYHLGHQAICVAMVTLFERGAPIDEATLRDELVRLGTWECSGGARMLASLCDKASTESAFGFWCTRVKDYALRRALVDEGLDTAKRAQTEPDAQAALEVSAENLSRISEAVRQEDGVEASHGVTEYMRYLGDVHSGKIVATRIPTGIYSLDEHLGGGLKTGWQVQVMTASGHGKTSFAVNNLALSAAKAGFPVLIVSLEMKPAEIYARLIGCEAGVSVHYHERVGLDAMEHSRLAHGANIVKPLPIRVVASQYASFEAISGVAKRMRGKYGRIGMVVVDYIQMMRSSLNEDALGEEVIAANSSSLKRMAVELDCVTVVLSQPTLGAKRARTRPHISDAKGSGSIEDDCDLALVPWLPGRVDETASVASAELGMDKFRHGPQKHFSSQDIRWAPNRMRFEEV